MVANDNNMEILQYVMWKIKELFITRLIMNDYDVTDFIIMENHIRIFLNFLERK